MNRKAAMAPQHEVQGTATTAVPPAAPDADKEGDADTPPPTPEQLRFQRYRYTSSSTAFTWPSRWHFDLS